MNLSIKLLTSLLVAYFSIANINIAFSQTTTRKNSDGSTSTLDANGNVLSTSYDIPNPSANQGAHRSSSDNKKQALVSTAANVGMAALMYKAFTSSCSGAGVTCYWPWLAMGILSYAQATQSSKAGGNSGIIGGGIEACPGGSCLNLTIPENYVPDTDGSTGGIFDLDPTQTIPGNGPYKTVGQLQAAMKDIQGKINESGYKVDMEGQKIISPDGTETPFSAVNDMASNGTGMDAAHVAEMKEIFAEAEKQLGDYKITSASFDEGGGGGGGGSNFKLDPIKMDDPFADYFNKLKAGRQPAAVAGMKRLIEGGESIGVAGDDIFQMIHRSYQRKVKQNEFIK